MPYVEKHDRRKLEAYISSLAEDIGKQLSSKAGLTIAQQQEELGVLYKSKLLEVADALIDKESGRDAMPRTAAQRLGHQIFDVAKRKGGSIRVDWLGNLNYTTTRLIQQVPRIMIANHGWKEEFGYPLYALTAGAIEQCALEIRTRYVPGNIEWVLDGLVGVFFDISDEYKRRVNIAYEAVQIKEKGDAFDAPFRTEVIEVKTADGRSGYQEIMRDFSGSAQKRD
jgi:hypothetical protein